MLSLQTTMDGLYCIGQQQEMQLKLLRFVCSCKYNLCGFLTLEPHFSGVYLEFIHNVV